MAYSRAVVTSMSEMSLSLKNWESPCLEQELAAYEEDRCKVRKDNGS